MRAADQDDVDRLARLVSDATVAAYVELFPWHDGAKQLLAAHPELKAQGRRYYESIARRLLAAGVRPGDAAPAPARPRAGKATEDGGLFG